MNEIEGSFVMANDFAQTAVKRFLQQQIDSRSEKLRKQLEAAWENGDEKTIAERQSQIQEIEQKFEQDAWLALAANSMAKQLQFGTHISKGIHPDAKGDNVNFIPKVHLPNTLVGTHSLTNPAWELLITFFYF